MSKKRILVVDDEPNLRRVLQAALEKAGHIVETAEDASFALRALEENPADLVLTDATMPGMDGLTLTQEVCTRWPETRVVIMTAFGTIPLAVQAMRNGAFDFLTKPFDLDVLKRTIEGALRHRPSAKKATKPEEGSFIAESEAMREVEALVRQVADSRATVMIGGESGVGKEVVARALHRLSSRSNEAFVPLSCAAIPETLLEAELFGHEKGAFTGATGARAGRFEAADGGTLFLDEVGEIPLTVQAKLLRAVQEREVERLGSNKSIKFDLRLVTATHRDLDAAVAAGNFRLDLLYRLRVVEIYIPPLRERPEDLLPLAEMFLKRSAEREGRNPLQMGRDAERALLAHAWPGNVRELENVMERATVLAASNQDELTPGLLPGWSRLRLAA
ncbi:sigma-54-dependent Fis family transcriptional regulator [bacterium]|nr:MAG: sigma-54-dependent Fis family transcriptional regulator [bacterium]